MPGSKGSKRLNSEGQFGTRTKKRNKSGKKKEKIYVNVNNKIKKLGRYMEKRKALTGIKTKRKINSKVNSARQKCSSLATYCAIPQAQRKERRSGSRSNLTNNQPHASRLIRN